MARHPSTPGAGPFTSQGRNSMPKAKKNKQTGKMEAVRSHKQKRAIQDSDAFLSKLAELLRKKNK